MAKPLLGARRTQPACCGGQDRTAMKYIGEKKSTSHLEIMNDSVERHVKRTARDFRISTGIIGDLAYLDSIRTKITARNIEMIIDAI
jgi:hypothetical protein